MTLSILQLNINGDNFWNNLIKFIRSHDFDILQLQEVCGKNTIAGNLHTKIDCYKELQNMLNKGYNSEFAITQTYASSPNAYMANATFYKKDFTLIQKNIITLYERSDPFPADEKNYEKVGRNVLHLTLNINDKNISFLNAHLAWAKTTIEQPHQSEQGKILFTYLQTIAEPFVLTGDFNIDPNQPLIKKISGFTQNLVTKHPIKTTLNPRTHRARVLFPPGAVVDYIFVSKDIVGKKISIVEEDLSDHLGLTAEIKI